MIKQPGGNLSPAFADDAEILHKVKNYAIVSAKITQPRNPEFHAKFFALLNLAFDYWEPEKTEENSKFGEPVKDFERFRKDVQIMAGHRTLVVNVKNEVRYEAKSISFGSLDEIEFNKIYRSVFNVCWNLVLSKVTGMTEEQAENAVNQMMSFN